MIGGVDDVGDVSVHEHLARLEPGDDVGRHARIRAADPQVFRTLQFGQAAEVIRVVGTDAVGPQPVAADQFFGHGGCGFRTGWGDCRSGTALNRD